MRPKLSRVMLATALAAVLACTGCDVLQDPVPSGKPPETVGVDPSGEHIDTSTAVPADVAEQPLVASEPAAVAEAPAQQPPTQPQQPKPAQPAPQPASPAQTFTPDTKSGPAPSQLPKTGGSAGVSHHHRAHGND